MMGIEVEDMGGGGAVLIIDDERFVRSAMGRILSSLGYEALEAESGSRGIELLRARKNDIQLVLVDLGMPEMNGEETLRELRSLAPDLKAVVLSGHGEGELTRRFAGLRPEGVLAKPFTTQQLAACLARVLGRGES